MQPDGCRFAGVLGDGGFRGVNVLIRADILGGQRHLAVVNQRHLDERGLGDAHFGPGGAELGARGSHGSAEFVGIKLGKLRADFGIEIHGDVANRARQFARHIHLIGLL